MAQELLSAEELDFGRYLELSRRVPQTGNYAYGPDLATLRTFRTLRPVELAVAAVVRVYKDFHRNELLGTTIRVGPRQLPKLHQLATECAETLGVPVPTLYVQNRASTNAYTFGTNEDSYVVLHSGLVDHFDEAELRFVIGHEVGHIQSRHVVYSTALRMLSSAVAIFVSWTIKPATLALQHWSRSAEISCDRAGLICCKDVDVARRSLMKLACGSKKIYEQLDLDSYLEQLQEGRQGVGRFQEFGANHPYLPKRVHALGVFAQSALYRSLTGQGGDGLSMAAVDRQVAELLSVMSGPRVEDD